MRVLEDLKPNNVFRFFEEICNIPHGSGNTDAIAGYCMDFALKRGLECIRDEYNNVIIRKAASAGCRSTEPLLLHRQLLQL